MNTKLKNLKTISCLLTFLIFFQSCKVYRYSSVSLEDVYKQKQSVKIITTDNNMLKFYKIDKIDDTYYGYKSKKNMEKDIKTTISPNKVKNIKVYKETAKKFNTIKKLIL